MKIGWLVIALAIVIVTSDASYARTKHAKRVYRAPAQCVDRPVTFSWGNALFGGGPPAGPNGCAPPVYQYGRYVGQDPDPFIRLQLMRDPKTGSAADFH
jgi:hypothetical protein